MVKAQLIVCVCLVVNLVASSLAMGQDVTEAPPNFVFYELSNLRIERDILGEVIAFDYRRTREGMGLTVSLKARSESGPVTIAGYSEITDRSGTIRLEERDPLFRSLYSRLRSDKQGIEFYFIAAASPIAQLNNDNFWYPISSSMARLLSHSK